MKPFTTGLLFMENPTDPFRSDKDLTVMKRCFKFSAECHNQEEIFDMSKGLYLYGIMLTSG